MYAMERHVVSIAIRKPGDRLIAEISANVSENFVGRSGLDETV